MCRIENTVFTRLVVVICVFMFVIGCTSDMVPSGEDSETVYVEDTEQFAVILTTPQIVNVLETADIAYISTAHDQSIYIELKNGKAYQGTYMQAEAGRYSKEARFFDILNLVSHILENRPSDEVKDIMLVME